MCEPSSLRTPAVHVCYSPRHLEQLARAPHATHMCAVTVQGTLEPNSAERLTAWQVCDLRLFSETAPLALTLLQQQKEIHALQERHMEVIHALQLQQDRSQSTEQQAEASCALASRARLNGAASTPLDPPAWQARVSALTHLCALGRCC